MQQSNWTETSVRRFGDKLLSEIHKCLQICRIAQIKADPKSGKHTDTNPNTICELKM